LDLQNFINLNSIFYLEENTEVIKIRSQSINVPPTVSTSTEAEMELFNPTDVRVLDVLIREGPLTRGQLVTKTNIARSTLYDSLLRLILKGRVNKFSERPQGPGRPKVFFQATS
jgi:hypothetical protein